jgi:phospholipid/cholesterol/gamma-HCH transport system substrate-binding protein
VTLNGFKVGLVNTIDLADDQSGKIAVNIVLERSFDLPKNSVAEIYNADLLGSKAIRFRLGNSPILAESGDTLEGRVEPSLSDLLSPVKDKADKIMNSIDSVLIVVLESLDGNFSDDFKSTIQHLKNSAQALDLFFNEENGQFPAISSNIEDITLSLKNNTKKFDTIMDNMESLSDSLAQSQFKSMINNMSTSLLRLNELLEGINEGKGTIGALATNDTLYQNLESLSHNLDLLLMDMKDNPKKYVHFSVWGGGKSEKKQEKKK